MDQFCQRLRKSALRISGVDYECLPAFNSAIIQCFLSTLGEKICFKGFCAAWQKQVKTLNVVYAGSQADKKSSNGF